MLEAKIRATIRSRLEPAEMCLYRAIMTATEGLTRRFSADERLKYEDRTEFL